MKILIFSDSHRNISGIRSVLDTFGSDAQALIHLGDCTEDAKAIAALYPGYQHYGIQGNCDSQGDYPGSRILTLSGRKIFLTHGHSYGVKYDYTRIAYAAEEKGVQICLFGHTHTPVTFTHGDIDFMNPGSISLPRSTGFPSFGVIDLPDKGNASLTVVGKIDNLYRPVDVQYQ